MNNKIFIPGIAYLTIISLVVLLSQVPDIAKFAFPEMNYSYQNYNDCNLLSESEHTFMLSALFFTENDMIISVFFHNLSLKKEYSRNLYDNPTPPPEFMDRG